MSALLNAIEAGTCNRARKGDDVTGLPSGQLNSFLSARNSQDALTQWLAICPPGYRGARLRSYLSKQIAQIDEMICEQLNAIIHHGRFQSMEARWLGLWQQVDASGIAENIKIKLLDVSWRELVRDIERAPDVDQSALFHLVYNLEFGTPGGEPFGVLLGDYEVSHKPDASHPHDDIATLQGISRTAAAAFAPFICGASPRLFGLDNFQALGQPININSVFEHKEYTRWHAMRSQDDTRFVALALPKVLMRRPYNRKFQAFRGIRFQEHHQSNSTDYLWGNACFAIGTVLIREFAEVGWFSHIRGVARDYHGGGLVSRFPSEAFATDTHPARLRMNTQVLITDFQERELTEQGLISLCHCYDTPYSAFNAMPSLQAPKKYNHKSADANARISAMLQQVMCASRFAQYIKVMIRDKVGAYIRADECERMLQQWLDRYTTGRDDLSWEMLARYPLREARVEVQEEPGNPGVYQSVIHLKTHYNVDQLVSELRLTTSLATGSIGTVK